MSVSVLNSPVVDLTGADVQSPGAGSNRVMLVIDTTETNATVELTAVTVGGVSVNATRIKQKHDTTMDIYAYFLLESELAAMSGTAISRTGVSVNQTWITFSVVFQDVDQTTPFTNTQEIGFDIDSANSTGTQTYTLDEVLDGLGVVVASDSKTGGTWGFNGGYSQLSSTMADGTSMECVIATKAITANASAVSTDITNSLTADKMNMFAVMLLPASGGGNPAYDPNLAAGENAVSGGAVGVIPEVNGFMHQDTPDGGGALSFTITQQPTLGALLKVYQSGRFLYEPNQDAEGLDEFVYDLYENGQVIDTVTVSLNIVNTGLLPYDPNLAAATLNAEGGRVTPTYNPPGLTAYDPNLLAATCSVQGGRVTPVFQDSSTLGAGAIYAPGWRIIKKGGDKHKTKLYANRSNVLRLKLLNDGELYTDIVYTTRMIFNIYKPDNTVWALDSDVDATDFNWSIGSGLIDIRAGEFSFIDEAIYRGELIVYNAQHPDGVVFIDPDDFEIEGA